MRVLRALLLQYIYNYISVCLINVQLCIQTANIKLANVQSTLVSYHITRQMIDYTGFAHNILKHDVIRLENRSSLTFLKSGETIPLMKSLSFPYSCFFFLVYSYLFFSCLLFTGYVMILSTVRLIVMASLLSALQVRDVIII